MYPSILQYIKAACAAAIALAIVACSGSSGDNDIADGDLRVAFTLSVDDTQTRAAGGWDNYDPADPGTIAECAINPDDIHIKVCAADGSVLGNVDDVHMTRTSSSEYAITGTWSDAGQLVRRARKVMVLANCGEAAGATDDADIEYSLADTKRYIPMWGVGSFSSLALGKSTDIGNISMLRAMAKVKVLLRDDMAARGYTIGSVAIDGYNTRGYSVPLTFRSVSKTTDIKFATSLHPLDSKATDGPLDFSDYGYVYLPEYSNTQTGDTPSTISVDLYHYGKHEGYYTLHFRGYDSDGAPTGTPYDIQRNHYYQFVIYKQDDKTIVALHVRKWFERVHDDIIL